MPPMTAEEDFLIFGQATGPTPQILPETGLDLGTGYLYWDPVDQAYWDSVRDLVIPETLPVTGVDVGIGRYVAPEDSWMTLPDTGIGPSITGYVSPEDNWTSISPSLLPETGIDQGMSDYLMATGINGY